MLGDDNVSSPADALVLPMTDDLHTAITAATALQKAGIRTQLYTEKKKFKAKMNYANKLSVPFAVFLGEDEIAAGKVSVKNMESGEQQTLPLNEAAALIKSFIENRNSKPIIQE
jgi:histidyl-tRNA synthetase